LSKSGGKKVKEISLKICGVSKEDERLMIHERSRERTTEEESSSHQVGFYSEIHNILCLI